MHLVDKIFGKVSFIWKGNKKEVIKQSGKGLNIYQDQQGVTNIFNISNVTVQTMKELAGTEFPSNPNGLLNSGGKRFLAEQLTRQENLKNTIDKAKLDLIVDPQEVEQDWFLKWMEISQTVSRENIQDYLAKILSGEIKKTGTFSLRTLDVLKNISKKEIESFEIITGLIFDNEYFIKIKNKVNFIDYGIKFEDILMLREAGLLSEHDNTINQLTDIKNKIIEVKILKRTLRFKSLRESFNMPVIILSSAGIELFGIVDKKINERYVNDVKSYLLSENFELMSDITENT